MTARVQSRPLLRPGGGTPYSRPRSSLYMVHTPTLEPMLDEENEDDDDAESPSAPTTPSSGTTPEHEDEPSSAFLGDDAVPPCHVAESALTGGQGLFAARLIPRGTVILSEPPLFTQPLPPTRTNSTVMAALSQCTREEQREFFSLWNAFKASREGGRTVLPALGIFNTNTLPCGPASFGKQVSQQPGQRQGSPGEKGFGERDDTQTSGAREGIFLRAARLNHSCRPNVARVWDTDAQEMVLRALRDVQAGEELGMNYGDVDMLGTREERVAGLEGAFGFVCACDACVMEDEDGEESDRRRLAVRRLFEEVGACGKEPTLGMRKVKLALRLLRDEQLVHYETSFCFDAFQFCVMVSDFTNAKAWARKAWEASCTMSGPDSSAARMLKMYWANPRAHQLAGLFPPVTLSGPD